jgi:hypothetical protein
LVNSVIDAFEIRKEKEARVDGVTFLVTTKANHLLISVLSFFIKLLIECEYVLEHLEEKYDILEGFMIKCLDKVIMRY